MKVLTIFGTRPEAIKLLPVIKKLERFESVVCVTAQHRQMLDEVLNIFAVQPKYDLNIMQTSQSLSEIITNSLVKLDEVIKTESPDLILVHGDTSTTFAAALTGFYNKVIVGHVEAGLRTYDKYQPFPEEINRRLVANIADIHFAPTETSKSNLLKENVPCENIFVTGNTAIDCLKFTVQPNYKFHCQLLNELDYESKRVVLLTAHRRENIGEPLTNICHAVLRLAERFNDLIFIYPVHSNPIIRQTVFELLDAHEQIHLIEPLDVLDMHNLISKSYLVMTDSGGLQEEAPALHKPVVVLREVTERPEGLDANVLTLAGTNCDKIYNTVSELLTSYDKYKEMAIGENPFGDGNASERILNAIVSRLNDKA